MQTYRERPVQFGPQRGLVGILCTPPAPATSVPVTIMLSAGVLHRVGASRIHVEMARRLAVAGLPSFRFDLSGVGDSLPRNENLTLAEAVELDIDDAMKCLEEAGHGDTFVLLGLCSGAHDALQRAQHDTRVVGVFAIDLIGSFVNQKHVVKHYLKRLTKPKSWKSALSGKTNALGSLRRRLAGDNGRSSPLSVGVRRRLSKDELNQSLESLLGRGVQLAFYFTAGLEENYNYRDQFRDNHPSAAASPRCTSVFIPGSDHSLRKMPHREALVAGFIGWMERFRA